MNTVYLSFIVHHLPIRLGYSEYLALVQGCFVESLAGQLQDQLPYNRG